MSMQNYYLRSYYGLNEPPNTGLHAAVIRARQQEAYKVETEEDKINSADSTINTAIDKLKTLSNGSVELNPVMFLIYKVTALLKEVDSFTAAGLVNKPPYQNLRTNIYNLIQAQNYNGTGAFYKSMCCEWTGKQFAHQFTKIGDDVPVTLSCGHTFCKRHIDDRERAAEPNKCPTCKTDIEEPATGFKENALIIGLLGYITPKTGGRKTRRRNKRRQIQ